MTFPTSAGQGMGVLELPAGTAKAAGVVLLPEWWGVNAQIQQTARRYADEGFCVLVVDVYHGRVASNADEAGAMMRALDFGLAVGDIAGAVAFLAAHDRCRGAVAVTGYCMGGALTFAAAARIRGLACSVPFYGLPGEQDWAKVDAPIQAHFASDDDWATVAGAQQIKDAVGVPMELHVYDAKHAFCNERRPEVYDAAAANTAWERAVAFIRRHTA